MLHRLTWCCTASPSGGHTTDTSLFDSLHARPCPCLPLSPCSTLSTNKLQGTLPKEWAKLKNMYDL